MGLTRPKMSQVAKKPKHKDKKFYLSVLKVVAYLGACYALYTAGVVVGEALYSAQVVLDLDPGKYIQAAAGLFALANITSFVNDLL